MSHAAVSPEERVQDIVHISYPDNPDRGFDGERRRIVTDLMDQLRKQLIPIWKRTSDSHDPTITAAPIRVTVQYPANLEADALAVARDDVKSAMIFAKFAGKEAVVAEVQRIRDQIGDEQSNLGVNSADQELVMGQLQPAFWLAVQNGEPMKVPEGVVGQNMVLIRDALLLLSDSTRIPLRFGEEEGHL